MVSIDNTEPGLAQFPLAVAALLALVAAVTDWKSTRIPNWLTLPALVFGLGWSALGPGPLRLAGSALGVLLCAAAPLAVFAVSSGRAMGGGDVKVLAALGALTGPMMGLEIQLTTFSVMAACALVQMGLRGQLAQTLGRSFRLGAALCSAGARRDAEPATADLPLTPIKLGPALAIATLGASAARLLPQLGA